MAERTVQIKAAMERMDSTGSDRGSVLKRSSSMGKGSFKFQRQLNMMVTLGSSLTFIQKLRMAFQMLDIEGKGFFTLTDITCNTAQNMMMAECGVFLDTKKVRRDELLQDTRPVRFW
mmetsp:Transcript_58943/g.162942  ORF Transcript_58943/g.162942 Transcript_58943/m.162942 type:complete len:117 (+) Transcript_58943:73-423(+)